MDGNMPPSSEVPVKYNTPLRQAHRDLTRSRIRDAARSLFHEKHYDSTTMDEIALAAGLRRSTLYLHYRDKGEILRDIVADYEPKAKRILATLPGPKPSVDQVETWARKVARFVAKERVPLSIILEMRRRNEGVATLEALTGELLEGLGSNNPAFCRSADADSDPMLRARGLLLLQELTYTCEMFLSDPLNPRNKALLRVTAEDFCEFLERFSV
jgi:AcrR family transcriptional regulator